MLGLLKHLFKGSPGKKSVTYEEAKELARHEDPKVRRAIAANPVPLGEIDLLLARDSDKGVRTSLAEKIARLAPGLSTDERNEVRRMTYEALVILARDQVMRVRQILSETLKDVADAPPEIIGRLARDAELAVSAPLLEYSQVLTDDDLLAIIKSDPIQGALSAISRRKSVTEVLSDSIVASDDLDAVTELLGNASAQIREETLDRILDRVPDVKQWHEPLVKRPKLPGRVIRRLAQVVAENLVEILIQRKDLKPDTAERVREIVNRRLKEGDLIESKNGGVPGLLSAHQKPAADPGSARERARKLHEAGKLDNKIISEALDGKEREFVITALGLRAGLNPDVIKKVITTNSVKGIVAVAWKARLPMSIAVEFQKKLLHTAPKDLLLSRGGATFPLSEEEMEWQLDFFKEM